MKKKILKFKTKIYSTAPKKVNEGIKIKKISANLKLILSLLKMITTKVGCQQFKRILNYCQIFKFRLNRILKQNTKIKFYMKSTEK